MKLMASSVLMGTLLLLTQAQEPQRDRKIIHLSKITCKIFVEEMKREQSIIVAWLQGYYSPDPVIDVDTLLSDNVKLTEYCVNNPGHDIITAAETLYRY
jgi:hypothetical protein